MADDSGGDEAEEPRIVLTALGPDEFEYEVTVAMRGVYARDWNSTTVLGFVLDLLVDDFIGPWIGRRSPVRKVTVFRSYRDWRPIRKRYRAWYPDPDEALLEAHEIWEEIQRGHLRWLHPPPKAPRRPSVPD